jgi:hypothetical protein
MEKFIDIFYDKYLKQIKNLKISFLILKLTKNFHFIYFIK